MRAAVAPALLVLAAALALAAPPTAAAPLSPVMASLSSLAGDAAVAALQADARAAKITLAGVHDASMVVTTGSEQHVTLTIDDAPYKLSMHELDSAPPPAADAPATPALAATLAAAAAVVAGRGDGAPAALPLSAAATVVGDAGAVAPADAAPPPATAAALALAPFTLAGPVTLDLHAATDTLRLALPRVVEVPGAARVRVPAGAAVRVVGAATARLATRLPLGTPPPAWLADAYGVPVDGVAPGSSDVAPGAGALAAAAGARAAAERGVPPVVALALTAPGARLEVASLVDGQDPAPLKARLTQDGTVELAPRRVAAADADGDDDAPATTTATTPTWVWPLAGVTGSRLARADAALAELLAAARAARGGGRAAAAPPRLRVEGAGAEAVAFVRVRLDVTRTPVAGAAGAAVATLASAAATEQWDALVRVAPPAAPGQPPRVAALRAEKVGNAVPRAAGGGGGGAVTSVSVGPGAALAAVANATAAPDDHAYEFVYPPSAFVL